MNAWKRERSASHSLVAPNMSGSLIVASNEPLGATRHTRKRASSRLHTGSPKMARLSTNASTKPSSFSGGAGFAAPGAAAPPPAAPAAPAAAAQAEEEEEQPAKRARLDE